MKKIILRDFSAARIVVLFIYNKDTVQLMRKIKKTYWEPHYQYWTIPRDKDTILQFFTLFKDYDIEMSDSIMKLKSEIIPFLLPKHQKYNRRKKLFDRRLLPRSPSTERRRKNLSGYLSYQMNIRNYKPYTINLYDKILNDFAAFISCHLREVKKEDIKFYIDSNIDYKNITETKVLQIKNALKFLYGELYGKREMVKDL